jgi:two-component system sensor histidine kinase KdpD
LVENLLHMTRLSSGKVEINRQWHPPEDVIGSALNRMEGRLNERSIEIDIHETLPLVRLDAVLVEQLLVNLLENAAKYSPAGSPIEVGARTVSGGIEFAVSDRGPGFRPGEESQVFDLFYRGKSEATDRRGTGIGLAICRAVAELHDGRIEAENRPQGGATVRVMIPNPEPPPPVSEESLHQANA